MIPVGNRTRPGPLAWLAGRRLAAAFGVEMTNWWAEGRGNMEIAFSRSNGGLADHPIVNGRNASERVEVVTTFTGQALKPPGSAGAPPVLIGRNRAGVNNREFEL